MNTPESRTMAGSHILVQGLHRLRPAHLSVLLVHVVCAGSRVIPNPDAEVLNLERSLLVDDVQADDFAVGFLHFPQFHQEVPETGLGDNGVGCKDAHAVEFGRWFRLGGQVTAYHLVFDEAAT